MKEICGIIPCGRAVDRTNGITCNLPAHKAWYASYQARFARLSFPGIQRVIRNANATSNEPSHAPSATLGIQLPQLGDIPGQEVMHTFRARSIYCLETIQWACGTPIGWGKCYNGESLPEVLGILNRIWSEGREPERPSFVAYDKSCDLLRHIVTQNGGDSWLHSTKFIVDAWHYIGHRATDALCRFWCNPSPSNGSQPDLVLGQVDSNGNVQTSRAFNTETAEQFNAWLQGFESQVRQMSDVSYDFFIHTLMMAYKELVDTRVKKKGKELNEEFWRAAGLD